MKKILLIEDDTVMRENITEMLELAKYNVEAAENGKFGVELAKSYGPDLILCDVMMPELDGYGVLYLLSKDSATASIPFIFLTAKAERADQRKGMELGADDYLTKPFEEQELLNAVASRIRRNVMLRSDVADLQGLNSFIDEAKAIMELENLAADRKLRRYSKKDTVFHEGDTATGLYFVSKGKVKTYKMNEDGKEFIVGLHTEGDFFGYLALLTDEPYEVTAATLEPAELCVIPKQDFLSLVHRNHDVSVKFIRMLSNNLAGLEQQLLELAYDSVRQRVAEALLHLCSAYMPDDSDKFAMSISRNDLAALVGTATESLIRTLSDLKEEGLVNVKGSTISILDKEGLKKVHQRIS